MDIWATKHDLDLDKLYRAQIGPLTLWFILQYDEIHIAIERLENEPLENIPSTFTSMGTNEYPNLEWKRWIMGKNCNQISILPVLPDRPVVVRPDVPVKIPVDQKALFFVSIPVWIRIMVEKPKEIVIYDEPSIIRSNIWFGDLTSGELCYSLRTRARRRIEDIEPRSYRVTCPVCIRNTTESQFDVERFCVQAEYLKIYKGTTRLWTNEVLISYQGEDTASTIDYVQKHPEYEAIKGMISEARTPWKKTLFKKSIGTFKQLTGF